MGYALNITSGYDYYLQFGNAMVLILLKRKKGYRLNGDVSLISFHLNV